jgi:tRNA threonylcarbamoyladenosine biosynthesis protein TsaB
MSLILLIETATTSCSVALADKDNIIALQEIDQRNIHAEVITVFIEQLFKETDRKFTDLDAVAVSCGPGSYTGLRIGISTAKGLCFSLDKPLIAVDTLAAMAHGIINKETLSIDTNALVCPMIDARRMEVYTALFDDAGNEIKPVSADIIDENSFAQVLSNGPVIFFGDGAGKCKAALQHNRNAVFVDNFVNSAKDILVPALQKLKAKQFVDVAYFEPFYLKDFIAGVKKQ